MSTLRNRVTLIGHPGVDAETKDLENGKLAKFSMATNETYYNAKGEKVTDTQWHQVVAFGKLAETVGKYVRKGGEVAIEGKLTTRQYEDKNSVKRYFTEVVMHDLLLLGKKPS